MKIIVWGINYAPELTGIGPFNTALCEFLAENGHSVEMVTSFAYYPEWKKNTQDQRRFYRNDQINGVTVRRCWAYIPRRTSAFRRIVHEGSFVVSSLARVILIERSSLFVVVSPPLLLGMAAWVASVVTRTPFVFHVQDLQPDAAVGLGMLKKGWLTKVLYKIESFAYAKAARVSGISNGMLEMFRKKSVPEGKLIMFPNGIRLPSTSANRGMFRARHRISENNFLAIYSGNLGVKQGLNILIEAAKELKVRRLARVNDSESGDLITIVVAGDGAMRNALVESVANAQLKNVLLLPLQSETEYREMLADANCTLITQQSGTGSFFFPSKLMSAAAAAKPVVTVADEDSELARAVRSGGFGINVLPDRPDLLANTLIMLSSEETQPSVQSKMGVAGIQFAQQFEMTSILKKFCEQLKAVVEGETIRPVARDHVIVSKKHDANSAGK